MSKRNIGVLPMNEKYSVEGVDYIEDGGCMCENCGRGIKNVVTIKNSKGKKFFVGSDCADTLEYGDFSNYWEYQDMKKRHNNLVSALGKVSKQVKSGKFGLLFDLSMGLYLYSAPRDTWSVNGITSDRCVYKPIPFINSVLAKYGEYVKILRSSSKPDGGYSYWEEKGVVFPKTVKRI